MFMIRNRSFLIGVVLIFLFLPQKLSSQHYPKHELRGVWIATVGNIDWPSSPGLSSVDQKNEMTRLLDIVKQYNMNTVVFQIRPSSDAFYKSSYEPWSQWLTGEQGKVPDPFYDPLEFLISECRKRGLDVHVWINPYRALSDTSLTTSADHITRMHPEWFVRYGKTVYFDPGLPQTRDYVSKIVSDIVRRYDIDAIHIDDYFYPYRIANLNFPDDSTFIKYPRAFSPGQKEDWRRENVNLIINQLNDSIRKIKPWVEFGISPFGVWRNRSKDSNGSETKAGQTNYDDLYADILLWEKNKWIDYITPQIYWHRGFKIADYDILTDWWSHNANGCKLYIGQAPYRIDLRSKTREWRTSKEIIRQIQLNRTYPNINGSMFFSAKVLRRNPIHLRERITNRLYHYTALPPSNNRITPIIPQEPSHTSIIVKDKSVNLLWKKESNTKKFIIYKFKNGKPAEIDDPQYIFAVTSDTNFTYRMNSKNNLRKYNFYITSQSQTNTESDPVSFIKDGE